MKINKFLLFAMFLGCFVPVSKAQVTVAPFLNAEHQFFTDAGTPCSGCKLNTYAAGTTNALATYSDSAGSTPNANPVVLNSAGRATIYLQNASYKFVLTTSAGVTIWTQDNVSWATIGSTVTSLIANGTVQVIPATAATSGANQSGPNTQFCGNYWNGVASAADCWTVQDIVGTGTNPTSTLSITHSGSTGTSLFTFPAPIKIAEGTAPSGITGFDLLWGDSTDHRWKVNNNNGTSSDLATLADFAAPPAIGNTTPAAITGTTITANTSLVINGGTALTTTNRTGTGNLVLATSPTIATPTLTSPVVNGTPSGTGIPTLTLKKGSAGGNYTTASTTYVVVDATNLCYTVTIPTGWKLSIVAVGQLATATAAVTANVAITDNAACSTANSGTLYEESFFTSSINTSLPFALSWVINGDGASHNIAMQFKTSNASDSAVIPNSAASFLPVMTFNLTPSN